MIFMINSLTGCLLINKKVGLTSRQEVNNISHILKEKKCGHIGTLDPFASGLLIVLVGKATKISPFLERENKTYIATLKLGQMTDSGDLDGKVILEKEVPQLTKKQIQEALDSFLGKSFQIPPMYSALKKDGKHLYDYARKGIEIARQPREINVYNIILISFKQDEITFEAKVSKGTYIRTLGEDIAKQLNCVGHLVALKRTAIGEFELSKAIDSDNVTEVDLISIEDMLRSLPTIYLEGREAFKANNGVALKLDSSADEVILKDEKGIIAVYKKQNSDVYSCLRGFR